MKSKLSRALGQKKKIKFIVTRPTLKVFISPSKDNYLKNHNFAIKQCFQHVLDRYFGD